MFTILGTPFHSNYLIIRMIVSGTPIPFLSHSLLFINLMPTYSIQIIPFSFVHQFHAHYLFPFRLSYFLFVHQSDVHYPWYTYSIQLSLEHPFHSYLILLCSSISCPLPLVHLFHSKYPIGFYSSISCTLSLVPLCYLYKKQK